MKLYEIASKYDRLIDDYNNCETDEGRELVLLALKNLEASRDEKLDACCKWLRSLEAEEEAVSKEIANLQSKLFAAERKKEAFKAYIAECLGVGERWSNGVFSLSWRKSEAVKIADWKQIPAAYMEEKIEYAPKKNEIKADLKAGATIPGAELEVRHNLQVK